MVRQERKTTREVFQFIQKYTQQHTHPPTIREIAEGCFLSTSSVTRHLDRLEEQGRLSREVGKARGITLLKQD
jgi:repressor LexA